jgi:hypothetical protein
MNAMLSWSSRSTPSEFQQMSEPQRKSSVNGNARIAQTINRRGEGVTDSSLSGGIRLKREPFSRLALRVARLGRFPRAHSESWLRLIG